MTKRASLEGVADGACEVWGVLDCVKGLEGEAATVFREGAVQV